jgi:hypothetical protein
VGAVKKISARPFFARRMEVRAGPRVSNWAVFFWTVSFRSLVVGFGKLTTNCVTYFCSPAFQSSALSGERFGQIAAAGGERRAGERRLFSAPARCPRLRRRRWLESAAPWSAGWIGGNGVEGGFRRRCRRLRHGCRVEGWVLAEVGISIGRLRRQRSSPTKAQHCPWPRQPVPNSTIEPDGHRSR